MFVDSSDPAEIQAMFELGVVSGVTTNPLILAKQGTGDLERRIRRILGVSQGDVSVEVVSEDVQGMVNEARRYFEWDPDRIVIKVPVTEDGLRVMSELRELEIPVNATCVMSALQGYMASLAGARYVSVFWGRIADMGQDPEHVVRDMVLSQCDTTLIAGSLRSVGDVRAALGCGVQTPTVTPDIIRKMVRHPRTESTIAEFAEAWRNRQQSA